MPRLTKAGVADLLRRRVGEERAAALLDELDEHCIVLLSLPQNLELALELFGTDGKAPCLLLQTEEALYREVFQRQFDAWSAAGKGDFFDLFTADAYRMLRDRAPAQLPPEIVSPLIERKLMRRLGDAVYFSHDTLRAYAAALHLANCWRERITSDAARINTNWDAMLRFTAARMLSMGCAEREVRDLLYTLLDVAPQRAVMLFKWVERERPEAVAGFQADFDRCLGEKTRSGLTNPG